MIRLEVGPNALTVAPHLGAVRDLRFGHTAPLHTAPWINDPAILADDDLLPVERELAGDFFCAPFGGNDLIGGPAHGTPANAPWEEVARGADFISLRHAQRVLGAEITKTLRLRADAPVLQQTHEIVGGEGALTIAHHPMVRLSKGGRISFSAKRCAITPDAPLEPTSVLEYPARTTDLTAFPGKEGAVDFTSYPIGERHEDFVTLIEEDRNRIGWTAVLRAEERDIIVILKDPMFVLTGGSPPPCYAGDCPIATEQSPIHEETNHGRRYSICWT